MSTGNRIVTYVFAFVMGGLLTATAVLHLTAHQVEVSNAAVGESIHALQARAETCEAKARNFTVIYEYQPSMSVPVLNGAFTVTLGSNGNHPASDLKPVWVIAGQVEPYTNMPGARYQWLDSSNGATLRDLPAVPPPTVVPQ